MWLAHRNQEERFRNSPHAETDQVSHCEISAKGAITVRGAARTINAVKGRRQATGRIQPEARSRSSRLLKLQAMRSWLARDLRL